MIDRKKSNQSEQWIYFGDRQQNGKKKNCHRRNQSYNLIFTDCRYQSALLKEQVNRLYAAECELNRNWETDLSETENKRLGATKGTVQANSNRIKKRARLALAKKLGDAESISELTDT